MPEPDASVSKVKGKLKFRNVKTGACMMACLSLLKALVVADVQLKASFFNNSVIGEAIVA